MFSTLTTSLCAALMGAVVTATAEASSSSGTIPWEQLRPVPMSGGLKVFWNVEGGDDPYNFAQAAEHGFELVDLVNTYSDYPGGQRENIQTFKEHDRDDPWAKPEFFERIIRRNIALASGRGALFVHDIEFPFVEDLDALWANPKLRQRAGAKTRDELAEAYYREWATWYSEPADWAREHDPKKPVGIYGPQLFRRDYWGLAGRSAAQIDGSHANDERLWKYLDAHVDFYLASVYVFYDTPDSIYYLASNIEENHRRALKRGEKPLYAYEWLRYHDGNPLLKGREVGDYFVEAMAVLPYFTGARGLVLWGWEPGKKGQYYQQLPLFLRSLGRVSDLSSKIASAELVIDEPAHVLWRARRPLVRKLRVSTDEWIILAVNPWQPTRATSRVDVTCGSQRVTLTMDGKHTEIYHLERGILRRIPVSP